MRLTYVGALQHDGLQASGLTFGGRCFEQLCGDVDIKVASRSSAVPKLDRQLYASVSTRPGITMAVSHLSRYMSDPSQSNWEQAKRVLRYLKGTADSVLMYGGAPSSKVVEWSDSDYASDIGERRSRTRYVFMLNGATVSWKSQRQQTVALSTAEAE